MKHTLTPAETAARRDMFAAAALTGLLANSHYLKDKCESFGLSDADAIAENVAIDAKAIADEMIATIDETK